MKESKTRFAKLLGKIDAIILSEREKNPTEELKKREQVLEELGKEAEKKTQEYTPLTQLILDRIEILTMRLGVSTGIDKQTLLMVRQLLIESLNESLSSQKEILEEISGFFGEFIPSGLFSDKEDPQQ